MRSNRAFTLIELMIVISIISVIIIIAIPSMIRARIAANETSALAACKALATAENIYKRSDYDHDGVLEYAQFMSGDNSLLESKAGANDLGMIDRSLAMSEGEPGVATGKNGYTFTILTSQSAAAGTARGYLTCNIGGTLSSMVLGFGISAVPAGYDLTGRSSFIISETGTIYLRDRGTTGVQETQYDPDIAKHWAPAE
ncbi:MAG: DUF2950 family protein [Planctomycetota bacterium]|nr:DUF2950 family protein [Planctomycetota bacterium]